MRDSIRSLWRDVRFTALCIYGPVILLLGAAAIYAAWTGTPLGDFTRDPATIKGFYPTVGAISNVGVLLWTGAASICLLASWIGRVQGRGRMVWTFFLVAGLLSALLMLDDFFMIHDRLGWDVLHLTERRTLLIYALIAVGWLLVYRRIILGTDWIFLLLAVGCFGVSMAVDLFWESMPYRHFFEDGSKFLGIAGWFAFHLRAVRQYIVHAPPV